MLSPNGHTQFIKDTWYEGLELEGNTSINPFFYGTYLGETKPDEPVTRTKEEAFQADAIGVAHQLTPSHFQKPHTFRIEWQPGKGGRLDWFLKNYKVNNNKYMEGDGNGQEWVHVFSIEDDSLQKLTKSQIPIEPTYLLFNIAVSSTWGFPYDAPDYCPKCYDCDDPKCACRFYPGFCQMLRSEQTAMLIDFVRVYQSTDPTAHVGAHHSLGCDPPEYPTREWIYAHEYLYMRNPPFSYDDHHPLRTIARGGALCTTDDDCGGNVHDVNLTAAYISQQKQSPSDQGQTMVQENVSTATGTGRGTCVPQTQHGLFGSFSGDKVCSCQVGYTGPRCMTIDHIDESPSARVLSRHRSPFTRIYHFKVPSFMMWTLSIGTLILLCVLLTTVRQNKKFKSAGSAFKPILPLNGGGHPPKIYIQQPPNSHRVGKKDENEMLISGGTHFR
jgi:Beta-glucan synthesis-associated protein SKN1/KRE6/Sbg1